MNKLEIEKGETQMKIYRNIALVVSFILGVSFGIYLFFFSPNVQMAINDPVTKEDYELLKENALEVAKTLDKDALNDKTLTADFNLETEKLVVTVESIKAKVTANIPFLRQQVQLEDETIIVKGTVEFEKVEFVEKSKIQAVWWYGGMSSIATILVIVSMYALLQMFIPYKKNK